MNKILEIKDVSKTYKNSGISLKKTYQKAVKNVSLEIYENEILALVGESGSGKTTIGKCILNLQSIDSGTILYKGEEISGLSHKEMKPYRKKIQYIFQDPLGALNPNMKISQILEEPLIVFKETDKNVRQEKIKKLLDLVGLDKDILEKYPKQISGGQAQRVLIMSVLLLEPEFIVADEVSSALDVSIQAQILNLLKNLQEKMNLTILFITHDLSVARYLSDRIAIMQSGEIVEIGETETIFNNPQNNYTKRLFEAAYFEDYEV